MSHEIDLSEGAPQSKEQRRVELIAELDRLDRARAYIRGEIVELNWDKPYPSWNRFCQQHPQLCLEELNDAYENLIRWHRDQLTLGE